MTGLIDGLPSVAFTRLSQQQILDCRVRAAAAGGFVDPIVLTRESSRIAAVGPRWAQVVLGRPYRGVGHDTWPAFLTLLYAAQLEPEPPADPIEREAHTRRQREEQIRAEAYQSAVAERRRAWTRLRGALPVDVAVLYNYAGRYHTEWYTSGADHIVLLADLDSGRLHRRAGQALCETPSKQYDFATPVPGYDDPRWPTCRACLRTAARLIGTVEAQAAAEALSATSRRAAHSGVTA